jgi:DNA-binding NtrC family response regulator
MENSGDNIVLPTSKIGKLKTLKEMEKDHILFVYEFCSRNKTDTAIFLGISRSTFYRKLAELKKEGIK